MTIKIHSKDPYPFSWVHFEFARRYVEIFANGKDTMFCTSWNSREFEQKFSLPGTKFSLEVIPQEVILKEAE